MDFEMLQKEVAKLEQDLADASSGNPSAMKVFCVRLRDILILFLKDRKEPVRQGRWFRDAAAKSIVPGDIAPRADSLLVRWAGNVTPTDPEAIKDDAARLAAVASKILPTLKSYTPK